MPLVLGGVRFDHPRGLAGHSDGDVLAHALVDAVLGAAGLGDIGSLFPPGDERFDPQWAYHALAWVLRDQGMLRKPEEAQHGVSLARQRFAHPRQIQEPDGLHYADEDRPEKAAVEHKRVLNEQLDRLGMTHVDIQWASRECVKENWPEAGSPCVRPTVARARA